MMKRSLLLSSPNKLQKRKQKVFSENKCRFPFFLSV